MIRCEATTRIARPPERVFSLLDDFERTPEWNDRCVSVTQTDGGPHRAGAKVEYRYRERGREGKMAGEIEVYEPGKRFVMKYTANVLDVRVVFELAADAGGTTLTHVAEIEPKSFILKLMSPVIRAATKAQTSQIVAKLKTLAEA